VIALGLDVSEQRMGWAAVVFWTRVSPGMGCWIWKAGRSWAGYGQVRFDGRVQYAHRVSWQLAHGDIPWEMFVCHTCDVPACVNPAHLFLGTAGDNHRDMVNKGRHRSAPSPKLTEGQVFEIRSRYINETTTHRALAAEYGVGKATITSILTGRSWCR
jgi:hypothetical protein